MTRAVSTLRTARGAGIIPGPQYSQGAVGCQLMKAGLGLRLLSRIERALFPPCCIVCGGAGEGIDLCAGCATDLPYDYPACPQCALPVPAASLCGRCLARPPPWEAAFALLRYEYPADALIRALKFNGQLAIGRVLGGLMAASLRERGAPQLILPVPLHPRRERERGFNQALELARPVARMLEVPIGYGVVTRTRATLPQSGLDARARRRNLRGAFALARPLRAEHVAIVDDVVTTGATVAALAHGLRRAGARRIEVWSAARAAP